MAEGTQQRYEELFKGMSLDHKCECTAPQDDCHCKKMPLPHTSQNGHNQKYLQIINAGEDVEKRETFSTLGGNVNS